MTISSWLNFGRPVSPGRGSAAGRMFLAPRYYGQRVVFASPRALFSFENKQGRYFRNLKTKIMEFGAILVLFWLNTSEHGSVYWCRWRAVTTAASISLTYTTRRCALSIMRPCSEILHGFSYQCGDDQSLTNKRNAIWKRTRSALHVGSSWRSIAEDGGVVCACWSTPHDEWVRRRNATCGVWL